MPFIEELKRWATNRGERTAVVVGEQRLDYAQLLLAAKSHVRSTQTDGTASVALVDAQSSTELAVEFCSAVLAGTTVMVLDAQWPVGLRSELSRAASDWTANQMPQDGAPTPFLLGLSSGTSGLPKAFARSAASWHESFIRSAEYFDVGPDSVTLAPGPMAASMNLYALGESIFAGATFVALPQFTPDTALKAIADNRVNRLVLVPTVLGLIAARGMATGKSGHRIRSIVCAGSELPEATHALAREWAPNAIIQQYYGAAELGFVAAATVAKPPAMVEQASTEPAATEQEGVGTAFPGARISIRDEECMELGRGQQGDVWVAGPYPCDGYAWGDDGLAFRSEILVSSGGSSEAWYTVRDQGFLDSGDRLHLAGRASDMVIISGVNVYPHHVEQTLLGAARGASIAHEPEAKPDAMTVIVAGIADEVRGKRLVAGICMAPLAVPIDAVRQAARQLPAPQRPSQYFELSTLPLTGSGKISRAILAQWITEGDARAKRLH
ncbi:class I adenylate-forming enzyme family protein [Arthrobacter sp. TWP1-1]|uniref:class I adenylate-forming enzyme family protein n=1 Tax=Arthrobacter sp. TWP1-1 TaxID=2804568 RepID=UPI003CE7672D